MLGFSVPSKVRSQKDIVDGVHRRGGRIWNFTCAAVDRVENKSVSDFTLAAPPPSPPPSKCWPSRLQINKSCHLSGQEPTRTALSNDTSTSTVPRKKEVVDSSPRNDKGSSKQVIQGDAEDDMGKYILFISFVTALLPCPKLSHLGAGLFSLLYITRIRNHRCDPRSPGILLLTRPPARLHLQIGPPYLLPCRQHRHRHRPALQCRK